MVTHTRQLLPAASQIIPQSINIFLKGLNPFGGNAAGGERVIVVERLVNCYISGPGELLQLHADIAPGGTCFLDQKRECCRSHADKE